MLQQNPIAFNHNNNNANNNNTNNAQPSIVESKLYVGSYCLGRILGKGQTGIVRLGVHKRTNRQVAIKIINREKLNESILTKIEREITIMKLIEHPHVLQLYDVYENKKFLFLVMEYVSNGDLFEYLLKKIRLCPDAARRFFKQIISALDFCHSHLICHRDLKPENLLLDDKLNIKIADFGMASLQVDGSMLETSCGSPHYACPEVIRGEKYDGRKADVWSCGVILYALLVGQLPFDDDNLKTLLERIKKGAFQIPSYVPPECHDLIRRMVETDPSKRITIHEINKHSWVIGGNENGLKLELPVSQVVQTAIIPTTDHIDTDVLNNMTSLGCFKDTAKLIERLLNEQHNIEKVIYFLLLDRKLRNPCNDEFEELFLKQCGINGVNLTRDFPRKRIDRFRGMNTQYDQLAIGSPAVGRRSIAIQNSTRYKSCHTTPLQSPSASPHPLLKDTMHTPNQLDSGSQMSLMSANSVTNANSIKRPGMNIFKRIHQASNTQKRKLFPEKSNNSLIITDANTTLPPLQPSLQHQHNTPIHNHTGAQYHNNTPQHTGHHTTPSPSPYLNTKSWFNDFGLFKPATSNNNSNYQDVHRDKEYSFLITDQSFGSIKRNLIQAFMSKKDLIHNITNENTFRCEYRTNDKLLQRLVKFRVEIYTEVTHSRQMQHTFKILFTHITGSTRVFNDLSQQICQLLSIIKHGPASATHYQHQQQQQPPPSSPIPQQQQQVHCYNTPNKLEQQQRYIYHTQINQIIIQKPTSTTSTIVSSSSLSNTPTTNSSSSASSSSITSISSGGKSNVITKSGNNHHLNNITISITTNQN